MNIDVYDIYSNNPSVGHFNDFGDMDAKKTYSMSLDPVLILPYADSNRAPYAIGKHNIVLDDLISIEESKIQLNLEKAIDLKYILNLFEYGLNSRYNVPQLGVYKLDNSPANLKQAQDYLSKWFYASYNSKEEPDYLIIPVPDRLNVDIQDSIIRACNLKKPYLLWNSVAAVMGIEESFDLTKIRDKDTILVVDYSEYSCTISYLSIHIVEGRLIPGHHIFRDSDTDNTTKFYFEYDKRLDHDYSIKESIPFVLRGNKRIECINSNKNICHEYMKGSIPAYNVDAIVFTGAIPENLLVQNDMWSNKITCEDANIWNIPNGIQVLKAPEQKVRLGCSRFANRMAHHKLSFYDECEALSLVVQTSDEDLKFKTLIAASEKLEGGLMINGEEVSGIKMQGGEELVKFYLRLGAPRTDGKLRIYNQILELDNDLIDNTRDIPLTLQARLIAGQGRAKVEIKPANKEDLEIFNGTMLNWETMELAVIEGTSQPKTLQYMIDHLERTFPINMDNVLAKTEWKSAKRKNNIERYLYKPVDSYDYSDALKKVSLNDPSWPNKNATDLTRFEKQNMFGSDQGDLTGLPQNASDCQLAKRLLEKLKKDYDALKYNEYRANEFKTVMRHISWTYQSKYFESIAVDILHQIEVDSRKAKREQLNICANLLRTNEHKIRLFKVFMRLSEIGKANSSTIKAMLEVFMHNTSFLDEANISKSQYYKVVQHMLHLYTEELRYTQYTYRKTILQFLTFYLKVRRVYPTFCKENSPENIDRYYYKEIKVALESHSSSRTLQWQEILSLYLDGKGNLDLPVDEIGMDDGDED